MKSIEIGKSAVVASQAALGVMRMDALDADAAAEVVRTAAEHGVNFFDTADIYGFNVNHDHASSRVLGRAWKDAGLKREDIFLQTKFGINIDFSDPNNVHATRYDFSAKHLITRLDEELEALGTDYVDFALLHRPDTLMEAEEIVEAFTTLHKAGKVRHFGVSNVNPWQAELLQSWLGDDPAMRLEANQLQFGLMHAQMVSDELMTNSGAEGMVVANHSDGLLSYSRLRHMTIQAWSPFQSGTEYGPFVGNEHFPELNKALDEKGAKYGVSANAIATAWVLRHPAKIRDRARLDEPHPAGRNARRRGHRPRQAGLVGPVRGRRQPHSVSFACDWPVCGLRLAGRQPANLAISDRSAIRRNGRGNRR